MTSNSYLDIRKQEEVLQESYMMVPDSKSRLEKALGELSELWDEFQEDESISAELREETAALLGMSASSSEAAAVTDL
jgi:vacuolar-type H+-ATPase catalytic subunit A/Vma1